jgi:hypothetical protein
MVPLALQLGEGSEMWSGMGIAVVGGMIIATMLTLFFVPIMYSVLVPRNFEIPEYEEEFERHHVVAKKGEENHANA